MTIGRWNGAGDGTLVNPFIITMPIDYDPEEPFQIRLDSNYLFNSGTNTYFKFSTDPATIYLLAIVVKDSDTNVYFKSAGAISYTMLLTSIVDYTDGPFITNTFAGVHYLLKQQIFSQNDVVSPSKIPSFIITALEPAARKQGDFWFDLELQDGQTDDAFDTPATNFIAEEADLIDAENTPFVEDNTETYDELGNYIINQF